MRRSRFKYALPALLLYLALTGTLFIINDYSVSFMTPIAPVIYGLCLIVVCLKRPGALGSISVRIIYAMSFLRMVAVPVVYVMSGYVSSIETSAGVEYLNEAVLLLCFELLCTTMLVLSSKKLSEGNGIGVDGGFDGRMKLPVRVILLCLALVAGVCVLLDSSVLVILSTIFDRFTATAEMNVARRRAYLSVRRNSSVVFNLFSQAVFYLQVLIPASLISYAAKRRNALNSKKGFALGLLIAAGSVLFITDNNIDSVCIMLACLAALYSVYNRIMKRLLPVLLAAAAGFIVLFLFSKVGIPVGEGIRLEELSRVLCAYFSAFPNVSCGFAVQYESKLATFWGDLVSGVPYMIALFRGYPQSVKLFNAAAYGYTGPTNQIMPLISYGYQYLWIFAPAFTLITYNLAFGLENRFRNTNRAFNQVLYAVMFINLSVGPCIFGFPSTIKRLCYYVPLLILANLNGDSGRSVRHRG